MSSDNQSSLEGGNARPNAQRRSRTPSRPPVAIPRILESPQPPRPSGQQRVPPIPPTTPRPKPLPYGPVAIPPSSTPSRSQGSVNAPSPVPPTRGFLTSTPPWASQYRPRVATSIRHPPGYHEAASSASSGSPKAGPSTTRPSDGLNQYPIATNLAGRSGNQASGTEHSADSRANSFGQGPPSHLGYASPAAVLPRADPPESAAGGISPTDWTTIRARATDAPRTWANVAARTPANAPARPPVDNPARTLASVTTETVVDPPPVAPEDSVPPGLVVYGRDLNGNSVHGPVPPIIGSDSFGNPVYGAPRQVYYGRDRNGHPMYVPVPRIHAVENDIDIYGPLTRARLPGEYVLGDQPRQGHRVEVRDRDNWENADPTGEGTLEDPKVRYP
jgi:hypothetical protein